MQTLRPARHRAAPGRRAGPWSMRAAPAAQPPPGAASCAAPRRADPPPAGPPARPRLSVGRRGRGRERVVQHQHVAQQLPGCGGEGPGQVVACRRERKGHEGSSGVRRHHNDRPTHPFVTCRGGLCSAGHTSRHEPARRLRCLQRSMASRLAFWPGQAADGQQRGGFGTLTHPRRPAACARWPPPPGTLRRPAGPRGGSAQPPAPPQTGRRPPQSCRAPCGWCRTAAQRRTRPVGPAAVRERAMRWQQRKRAGAGSSANSAGAAAHLHASVRPRGLQLQRARVGLERRGEAAQVLVTRRQALPRSCGQGHARLSRARGDGAAAWATRAHARTALTRVLHVGLESGLKGGDAVPKALRSGQQEPGAAVGPARVRRAARNLAAQRQGGVRLALGDEHGAQVVACVREMRGPRGRHGEAGSGLGDPGCCSHDPLVQSGPSTQRPKQASVSGSKVAGRRVGRAGAPPM